MVLSSHLAWVVGEIAAAAHFAIASGVTIHVLLNKRNVGAAISWMGIAWLSPFIGGILYFAMGVNRVKRRAKRLRRARLETFPIGGPSASAVDANPLTPLEYAIGRLTGLPSEAGNAAQLLRNGDEAYPAMIAAIDAAEKTVGLCSYIFRADSSGRPFIDALIRAHRRGVQVRVLIDGVGGGYFWSGTYMALRRAKVPVGRFLHSYFPWRTPFLNLRNHRKLMVVDGTVAFTGGLNIGAENVLALAPMHPVRDTHFRVEGPVIEQLAEAFTDDWLFETGEKLPDEGWFPASIARGPLAARAITSGPDEDLEKIEFVALHAISCARQSIRVVTPYFLPPEVLTTALGSLPPCAAWPSTSCCPSSPTTPSSTGRDACRRASCSRRGAASGSRPAPFDHSKLMASRRSAWSLIGSANWDTRSFRLNFELNLEIQGPEFARRITDLTGGGRPLTLAELDLDSLPIRLRNGAARLLQPYL